MTALRAQHHPAKPAERICHPRSLDILLTTVSSDSHTWNLVFLQLYFEYLGHTVENLGACVPDDLVVERCNAKSFDLLVVSSVNGHGHIDGERLMRNLRLRSSAPVAVIGGKLGIDGALAPEQAEALLEAGYTALFDASSSMPLFEAFVARISTGDTMELAATPRLGS